MGEGGTVRPNPWFPLVYFFSKKLPETFTNVKFEKMFYDWKQQRILPVKEIQFKMVRGGDYFAQSGPGQSLVLLLEGSFECVTQA